MKTITLPLKEYQQLVDLKEELESGENKVYTRFYDNLHGDYVWRFVDEYKALEILLNQYHDLMSKNESLREEISDYHKQIKKLKNRKWWQRKTL